MIACRRFFWGVLGAALIGSAAPATFAAPGDLDLTFAGTGKTRVGFGGGRDFAEAIAVQADSKVVVVGAREDVGNFLLTVLRYNPDGSLDTSFKGATQPYPIGSSGAAVKIQPDQKIVIAGSAENQFMAIRLNTDGTLDSSFNGTGIVITTAGTGISYAQALVIQSDGKIVLGGQEGSYTATSHRHFALVRYNADGTLDNSFDLDGKVSTDVSIPGGVGGVVNALAISGSTIVAAGATSTGSSGEAFAVARYKSVDGSLDTTFNNGQGFVLTPVGDGGYAYAQAVAIQPSTPTTGQTIVAGGYCEHSGSIIFALVRYNSDDGTRDTSFGNNGIVQTVISSNSFDGINSLFIQSTGNGMVPVYKIVVGGYTYSNGTGSGVVARYNSSGALDSTFGNNGGIIPSAVSVRWNGVALSSGNKIVAGGAGHSPGGGDNFVVARYNLNGSLDSTFDGDGQRADGFGNGAAATAKAVSAQADGKIVIAGYLTIPGSSPSSTPSYQSALIRLNADGTADTSFGQGTGRFVDNFDGLYNAVAVQSNVAILTGGASTSGQPLGSVTRFDLNNGPKASFSFSSSALVSEAKAIALQADGKVVVAGYRVDSSNHRDFAVARLSFSHDVTGFYYGVLDSSFGNNGVTATDLGTDDDEANAVAIQSDGKIVLAGQTSDSIAAVRYDSNGAIDTSFGVNGKVTTKVGNSINHGNGVVVQSDGKIVVTGQADSNLVLLRYGSAGTPDPSFGGTGTALVSLGANSLGGEALSLQGDDKILVTGSGNGDFVVLRFTKDGFLDSNYGGGVKVTMDVTGANDFAHAITLDSFGRAIVAGEADNLFGIARLQGDTAIPTPTPTPNPTATATPGLVGNVSTRLPVGTGDNALIEGFIVDGPAGSTKRIIVRAIGPSLTPFGIPDALANPTLEIHDASANNATVAANDDWKNTQVGGLITGDQSAEIASSGVPPSNDLESAIIANLAPGSYTAVVRGAGDTAGTGVVDAYDLSAASPARLANIATRGLVQPGDKLMIAGFIIQSGPVRAVVRAIGPSLSAFGITNALPDTTLQLRDSNGVVVQENDDWQSDQKQELESTGLQPTNDLEAALVTTIPPGQYTAQVRGKPETTGIGVVQLYFLQ
jgi:uncharacterized delta-60 repeat protein